MILVALCILQLRSLQDAAAAGSSATHQAQHLQQQLEDEREEHMRAREQLQALQQEMQSLLTEAQHAEDLAQRLKEEREARVEAQTQLEALQRELHSLANASEQADQVQASVAPLCCYMAGNFPHAPLDTKHVQIDMMCSVDGRSASNKAQRLNYGTAAVGLQGLLIDERARKEQAEERAAELEERLALAEERCGSHFRHCACLRIASEHGFVLPMPSLLAAAVSREAV